MVKTTDKLQASLYDILPQANWEEEVQLDNLVPGSS